MSRFTDQLWQDIVDEHGATLAHLDRPEPGRPRWSRPRVLAGGTLTVAGVAAALTLVLNAAAGPPAFAVTRQPDGSVLVRINDRSGIAGANRELAALGVHERVMAVGDDQPLPLDCLAPGRGSDGKSLVIAGFPKVPTGPVATPPTGSTGTISGHSGGPRVGTTWHLIACPSLDNR